MNNYEFYEVLLSHPQRYILLLLGFAIIHYFIFRRIIITILDPYLLPVVFSVFGATTVYSLYFAHEIDGRLLASFTLTQVAFFLGVYTFPSIRNRVRARLKSSANTVSDAASQANVDSGARNLVIFYGCFIITVVAQLVIYYLKGIPLLMESRLATFADGQGEGVLGRIVDVMMIATLYASFTVIRFDSLRYSEIFKYLCLLVIVIIFLLSGSKSGFLTIVQALWAYLVFSAIKGKNLEKFRRIWVLIKKHIKKLIVVGIAAVLLVIAVQTRNVENNNAGPLFLFGLRFVHSADIYWYAYPNHVYEQLDNENGFQALFVDFLGMLRIYRWEDLPTGIGIPLFQIHHPGNALQGPNARHNVFGLLYYGFFGSIIFSFTLGMIFSFIRNRLVFFLRKDMVSGMIFTYLIIKVSSIDSDPTLFITYMDSLIFVFPVMIFLVLLLTHSVVIKKRSLA